MPFGLLGLVALGGGGTTADPNDIRVRPGVAQLTWTGFAPTVLVAGASDVIVSPGVAQLTWTGFAPTVAISAGGNSIQWGSGNNIEWGSGNSIDWG